MTTEKRKVLIVDDEKSIRTLLSLIIGDMAKYLVSVAEDGTSALQSIERDPPDILLTDVHMPGMTGLDLMAAVRNRFPNVRVVAMSGTYAGNEIPQDLGADSFFLKNGRNWTDLIRILETIGVAPSAPPPVTSASLP